MPSKSFIKENALYTLKKGNMPQPFYLSRISENKGNFRGYSDDYVLVNNQDLYYVDFLGKPKPVPILDKEAFLENLGKAPTSPGFPDVSILTPEQVHEWISLNGGHIPSRLSFDNLAEIIRSSPVYADPTCKVLIIQDTIYFGHSFYELLSFFPEIEELFGRGSIRECFDQVDLMESSMESVFSKDYRKETNIIMAPTAPIAQRRKQLIIEASNAPFFEPGINENKLERNSSYTLAFKNVPELLNDSQGLSVGENHDHLYPKKLLIDNMKSFKEKGVSVIFLEHVFDNTQREIFEAYMDSDNLVPPLTLQKYLENLDEKNRLRKINGKPNPYSFLGLVIQAKRYGIKIIPIDTDASYCFIPEMSKKSFRGDNGSRCLMMNYLAFNKISEFRKIFPEDKFISFIGSKHVNKRLSGVPGLAEITNCPTIIAQDSGKTREANEKIGADYYLNGEADLSLDAIFLQEKILVPMEKTNNLSFDKLLDDHKAKFLAELDVEIIINPYFSYLLEELISAVKLSMSTKKQLSDILDSWLEKNDIKEGSCLKLSNIIEEYRTPLSSLQIKDCDLFNRISVQAEISVAPLSFKL